MKVELLLRRRLGEEVVDAGLRCDRRGGDRIVAGDHDRADAHRAQRREALLDVGLHDVLEVDDAEQRVAVDHRQRRAAGAGHPVDRLAELGRRNLGVDAREFQRRVHRALADPSGPTSTPDRRVSAAKGTIVSALISGCLRPKSPVARATIERPSGVSSPRLASSAASASSDLGHAIDRPGSRLPCDCRR